MRLVGCTDAQSKQQYSEYELVVACGCLVALTSTCWGSCLGTGGWWCVVVRKLVREGGGGVCFSFACVRLFFWKMLAHFFQPHTLCVQFHAMEGGGG
jgi:hypothetical protein